MFYTHSSNHSRGVLVLISETLQFDVISLKEDIHGRFVTIQALVQEAPFLLLNLYAPTKCSELCDFFEIISSVLEDMNTDSSYNIILGGDFNVHFNSTLDNLGGRMVAKSSVQNIKELMLAHDLVDIWRLQNPETNQFTWSQKNPPIKRRLDYWLISDSSQDYISKTNIIPAIKSDHSAIILNLNSFKDRPFGPSYWKFNSSLLNDEEYVSMITSQYPIWLAEFADVIGKRIFWDLIKYRIRQVTIRYRKSKSKKRKARLAEAEEKVKNCEMKYTALPSEDTSTELERSKQEYESLYDYIIQGKIIRSKATWYEKGEKNSKFFLNLESNRSGKTCIRRLFDSQGKIMVNSQLILDELRSFYQFVQKSRLPRY